MDVIVEKLGFQPFTPNEIAGFFFGLGIFTLATNAPKFDSFIANGQRRNLGLCVECGGVGKLPCKSCRGKGEVSDTFFSIGFDTQRPTSSGLTCKNCSGSGQITCKNCQRN